jgi:hypothetical protein
VHLEGQREEKVAQCPHVDLRGGDRKRGSEREGWREEQSTGGKDTERGEGEAGAKNSQPEGKIQTGGGEEEGQREEKVAQRPHVDLRGGYRRGRHVGQFGCGNALLGFRDIDASRFPSLTALLRRPPAPSSGRRERLYTRGGGARARD